MFSNRITGGALRAAVYSPEGNGGGDPPPAPAPTPAPAPQQPEPQHRPTGYSAEYVQDLRREAKGWREKAQETERAAQAARDAEKAAKEAAAAAKAEADAIIEKAKADAKAESDKRVISAELKALAIKAGMIDLDGLKLADLSSVKLNDAGEVDGGDALIESLKEAKPYLFGAPKSGTSSTTTPPKPGETKPKTVKEMSPEEYQAAKRAAIRGGV